MPFTFWVQNDSQIPIINDCQPASPANKTSRILSRPISASVLIPAPSVVKMRAVKAAVSQPDNLEPENLPPASRRSTFRTLSRLLSRSCLAPVSALSRHCLAFCLGFKSLPLNRLSFCLGFNPPRRKRMSKRNRPSPLVSAFWSRCFNAQPIASELFMTLFHSVSKNTPRLACFTVNPHTVLETYGAGHGCLWVCLVCCRYSRNESK
jgi:hypothetical protein